MAEIKNDALFLKVKCNPDIYIYIYVCVCVCVFVRVCVCVCIYIYIYIYSSSAKFVDNRIRSGFLTNVIKYE